MDKEILFRKYEEMVQKCIEVWICLFPHSHQFICYKAIGTLSFFWIIAPKKQKVFLHSLSFHRELELKRCCQPISFCAQEQPLQLCQFIGTVLLYGLVGSLCEEKEEVKFQSRAKLQLHPPPASHLVAMPCLCTISHIYRWNHFFRSFFCLSILVVTFHA